MEYFRLELEEHDLVWAEGLPAESYMYAGLRSDLHRNYEDEENGGALTLHPVFASYAPEEDTCLPLAVAGPAVVAARAVLARRAAAGEGCGSRSVCAPAREAARQARHRAVQHPA